MDHPESSIGDTSAFQWKTYSVQKRAKEPLLRFITEALEMRGCTILYSSPATVAPFHVVFEAPSGERHGVLAYAFFANAKPTRNRLIDEHRFQVKYGSRLDGILELGIDTTSLITTIFLGIDPDRKIFVAADPVMNNPSPMSRSVEFKIDHVDEVLRSGWAAWERERHTPKTKTRPTPSFDVDERIQILVGGTQEHLFDLIQLERLARGLDSGERHLVADTLLERPPRSAVAATSHALLHELQIPSEALFDLIEGASRLKMAVRGWVAESHLEKALTAVPGVSECQRIEGEGRPDLSLRWKGSAPIFVECKNALRKVDAAGRPRVDFQRTRASKEDPCSRYYKPSEFQILAACLHSITESWEFQFAQTAEMAPHAKCEGRISNNVVVAEPVFTPSAGAVFDALIARAV